VLRSWERVHELELPEVVPVALSHSGGRLLLLSEDGDAYTWEVRGGEVMPGMRRDAPVAGSRRTWRSACAMPNGKVMRLAANWRKAVEGGFKWHPELLL